MSTELVQLPTFYSAPGVLLLARLDDSPIGCIGLRALAEGVGEIRRLFVQPTMRSTGLGRALVERTIAHAHGQRVGRLVLNTLPTMTRAINLYEALGFRPIDPYVPNPTEGVRYYALDLPSVETPADRL